MQKLETILLLSFGSVLLLIVGGVLIAVYLWAAYSTVILILAAIVFVVGMLAILGKSHVLEVGHKTVASVLEDRRERHKQRLEIQAAHTTQKRELELHWRKQEDETRLRELELEVTRLTSCIDGQIKLGQFGIELQRFTQFEQNSGLLPLQTSQWLYQIETGTIIAPPRMGQGLLEAESLAQVVSRPSVPDRCNRLEVMRRFARDIPQDHLLLALGRGEVPIVCPREKLLHTCLDAPTDGGKTMLAYSLMIDLLVMGVLVILANPHFAPYDRKHQRDWRPIARAIEAQGKIQLSREHAVPGLIRKFDNIARMLKWLSEKEIDRRIDLQAQGIYDWTPVYLFLDEWPSIVGRYPEAAFHLVDILQRGRAFDICVSVCAQGFLTDDVQLRGSARENFQTVYHMGGSVSSASRMLDMPVKELNAMLREEQVQLGQGIALLRNNAALPKADFVRVPLAESEYAYSLLGRADEWQLPEYRGFRQGEPSVNVQPSDEPNVQQRSTCLNPPVNADERTTEAEVQAVRYGHLEMGQNKEQTILNVWNAKKGGTRQYQLASKKYDAIVRQAART